MQVLMFTKMLKDKGGLQLEEAAEYMADMGFDGADLTVRPGGYVLPEMVKEDLPKAVEVLKSHGLEVPMITTSITDPEKDHAEDIFETASRCGVEYIKLGYWRYEGFGKIRKQIREVRRKIEGIYRLSRRYCVTATIHTHAGRYLSADPALLLILLKGYDPEWLGAYIDPGHLFAELGPRGWEMSVDILAPYIRLVSVKNYRWVKTPEGWRVKMYPLKEEIVPWPDLFKCLRSIGFDGCISVHSEYHDLDFDSLIRQTREDLEYLRGILKATYG